MFERGSLVTTASVRWIPLAFLATILCALVGAAVQQAYRTSANDPQIQLAEDAAAAIAGGREARTVVPTGEVDLATSLAPFLIVFDGAGQPVASSARLEGRVPRPPDGVFTAARQSGENRFTWQPRADVREAAVVVPVNGGNGGYVLAGRSLREVEVREGQLSQMVILAWVAAMAGSLLAVLALAVLARGRG